MSKKIAGRLTLGLLLSCPFLSSLTAMPLQATHTVVVKSTGEPILRTKAESVKLTKAPVLARNTTAKAEPAPAKEQKPHDKKAISRCWNRLMTMVREISHTQRNNKK